MVRFNLAWSLLMVLASLHIGGSIDSINLDLEVLDAIDLRPLGTPNLDRHQGEYELTLIDGCQYVLRVTFKKHSLDVAGDAQPNFEGVCSPDNSGGNAPDGEPWHAHRRHWMRFPQYVQDTTGFNHVSVYWRPCGLPPKGLRDARYDVNFYTIIPEYRAFMTCDTFQTPEICQYNQSSFLGRGHFSIPRLERDPDFIADMPVNFQPDPQYPEAYEFEGLTAYNPNLVLEDASTWLLPTFHMSSYDGDVVSWRALLPNKFVTGPNSSVFAANQYYVYQRNLRLPSNWNMTYDAPSGKISVLAIGSAGMCGDAFDQAKAAQEAGNRRFRG